jgi:pimeloyl-ACP methyl ester carboxylesterase
MTTMPASTAMVTLPSGVTLSYAESGAASAPTVVLLPGPTDSWRSYELVLDRLPASIHAIAVSQRGHGDSDKPVSGYGVKDFTADVVTALDALGLDRVFLAGHSGSCLVARRVAIDHPERVVGLVLEASPTTLRGNPHLTEFVESVVSNLKDPIDPAFARSFVADTSSDHLAPELVDQLTIELLNVPAHVWKEIFADLSEYDDLADIERVIAPTLLVWGDWSTGKCRRGSLSAYATPNCSSTTVSVTLHGGRTRPASPTTSPPSSHGRCNREPERAGCWTPIVDRAPNDRG